LSPEHVGGLIPHEDIVPQPDNLLIPYEDFEYGRFNLVGRYGAGNQFMAFVTGAFPSDWWSGNRPPEYLQANWARHKRWCAVVHRFDANGFHLGTDVFFGGDTASGQETAISAAEKELAKMLAALGPAEPCDIRVKPFRVEIDGYLFGLIYECVDAEDPENPGAKNEYVMLEPNDIMFHPPWDSGEYST
jgi:hypothetical protein